MLKIHLFGKRQCRGGWKVWASGFAHTVGRGRLGQPSLLAARPEACWAGRAMPCGSSSKGTVCCHASLTAEGAQGGPGAGEGLARVPGRSPLPKLRHGDSATQHRRLSGPWEVRELQPGPPSPLRFSSVPSASQKAVRESLCAHEEPRRGGARVLGPPPSVWPSPRTGPWQALAASN